MSERISHSYRRFFEVRLLHHYWLDEGATIFDQISSPLVKQRRLANYDARKFLAIEPTVSTKMLLDAYRAVCIDTTLGLVVAVPEATSADAADRFEFVIHIKSQDFFSYTALTLKPQRIFYRYDADKKQRRFKENVPVLSNLTGSVRGSGGDTVLYLSKDYTALAGDDGVEALVLAGGSLLQLTSDQPAAETQTLSAHAEQVPVFLHQGDIPALMAPAGMSGLPSKGIELGDDIPDRVFALIQLDALNPLDDKFSLLDNGQVKQNAPVFEIRLKNRSTVWRYIEQNTGVTEFEESAPLPLTFFGNAGSKRKPTVSHLKTEPVPSGSRIDQLVSEVFV